MAFVWGVCCRPGCRGFGWVGAEGAKASGSVELSLGPGETEAPSRPLPGVASVASGQ